MAEHDAKPINLADYAELARRRADASTWDFIAGGSEDETTLTANRVAFGRWALRPRVLAGVTSVELAVELFETRFASPLLVAPMGYQALAHEDGELATARGAAAAECAMVVSSMSNHTLEDIAGAARQPLWFQLYCMRDRDLTLSLVRRAEAAGYVALVVTVDAPRLGRRERDLRNCFALPAHLSPKNLALPPTDDLYQRERGRSAVALHANALFDAALDWSTIAWLKAKTRLPLILKGILTREDATRAAEAGVDGIIVSNHGGRQLNGAPASLDALPEVVEAAGDRCTILLDGGIRRGTDVLKARALGARAVLVGRPVLWGLLASGAAGVAHVLGMLHAELEHAMVLCGQPRWSAVSGALVAPNASWPGPRPDRASEAVS